MAGLTRDGAAPLPRLFGLSPPGHANGGTSLVGLQLPGPLERITCSSPAEHELGVSWDVTWESKSLGSEPATGWTILTEWWKLHTTISLALAVDIQASPRSDPNPSTHRNHMTLQLCHPLTRNPVTRSSMGECSPVWAITLTRSAIDCGSAPG